MPVLYKTVAVPYAPQGLSLAVPHQTLLVQLRFVAVSWETDDLFEQMCLMLYHLLLRTDYSNK